MVKKKDMVAVNVEEDCLGGVKPKSSMNEFDD